MKTLLIAFCIFIFIVLIRFLFVDSDRVYYVVFNKNTKTYHIVTIITSAHEVFSPRLKLERAIRICAELNDHRKIIELKQLSNEEIY